MTNQEGKKIKVTLKRSLIGRPETQKRIVEALGIKKVNHSVEHFDTPIIRGMVNKITHLVSVE